MTFHVVPSSSHRYKDRTTCVQLSHNPLANKSYLNTTGDSKNMARTGADTVKTGLEFKGPRRAGTALIFGRGVKTLTFNLHSQALPLHLLKDREKVGTVCRGKIHRVCATYSICKYVSMGVNVCF